MAKRTPFTSQQERLERRIKNLQDEVAAIKGMVDTERNIITAQILKVDDPTSPQIIRVSEEGALETGGVALPWRREIVEGVSHTGDTAETEVGKITMPANSMGARGFVSITGHFLADGGGDGNRTYRMYFGGTLIALQHAPSGTGMLDWAPYNVWNSGATNAQETRNTNAPWTHSRVGDARNIMAIDTTADVDITFTVQNSGGAGLSSRLRFARVEAFYRD